MPAVSGCRQVWRVPPDAGGDSFAFVEGPEARAGVMVEEAKSGDYFTDARLRSRPLATPVYPARALAPRAGAGAGRGEDHG